VVKISRQQIRAYVIVQFSGTTSAFAGLTEGWKAGVRRRLRQIERNRNIFS